MANVEGVNIELPDGTRFEFRGNIALEVEQNANFLINPENSVVGVAKRVLETANDDLLDTPYAGIYLLSAAGTRRFEVAADNWEGETGQFGPANNSDSALEKLAIFEHELADQAVDATQPAKLEWGPYSSTSSKYAPISVVFPSIQPSVDFADGPTVFRSRFTAAESFDLSKTIDNLDNTDFSFQPFGSSTPEIPLPFDTLGAGRGVAELLQGGEVASSGIVDTTSSSGFDPTSIVSKLLPESASLAGAWRGDKAKTFAQQFKTQILENQDVDAIEITTSRTGYEPLTGTYNLGPECGIDPLAPQLSDGLYGFRLDLEEK